jgi:hypothetical protein
MAYINFDPQDYFNTVLYTGNGSTNAITGVGFQPDMCWWKMRSGIEEHALGDAVRGATKIVKTNAPDAQATSSSYFSSFDSDGFTLGGDSKTNSNGSTYASWNWKANGAGVSNTDGSTSSTVSANTTAGISIVKWTPSGSAETVGHGLGSVPKMILTKNLGASQGWFTYHHIIGNTKYLLLNSDAAPATDSTAWNNTTPTSSVFSVGSQFGGSDYVAYCFAEKKGFSKFGSYTGNGNADGPFIYTGFKPAFVIHKRTDVAGYYWQIWDNKRDSFNVVDLGLNANTTVAEYTETFGDFVSNGFKITGTNTNKNEAGGTYIYIAFAENPLVNSLGNPATAR